MQAFSLVSMTKSSVYDTFLFIQEVPLISSSIPYASHYIIDPLLHPRTFLANRVKQLYNFWTEVKDDIQVEKEKESHNEDDDFFYDSPNNVENWSNLSKKESTRESQEFRDFVEKIPRFNAAASNPFVSPLLFEDFSVLSSIDLHLISSHFDDSLDDNVSLARAWAGNVTLEVMEDNLLDLTIDQLVYKPLSASQGHSIVIKTINQQQI
jgi:hypothetical protein